MNLTDSQIDHYSRQILHPRLGGRGQARLLRASVLVDLPGDDALTETTVRYLAAAGVGRLDLLLDVADDSHAGEHGRTNPDCRIRRHVHAGLADHIGDADVVIARLTSDASTQRADFVGVRAARPTILVFHRDCLAAILSFAGHRDEACLACAVDVLDGSPPSPAAAAITAIATGCAVASAAIDRIVDPLQSACRLDLDLTTTTVRDTPLSTCPHSSRRAPTCIGEPKRT